MAEAYFEITVNIEKKLTFVIKFVNRFHRPDITV